MIKNFHFKNFKSFEKATFDIESITTLIGTNASGKSNAIEGIRILSEASTGLDFSIILDGSKNMNAGVRGGSKGCCHFDLSTFELGCTVYLDETYDLHYRICINVENRISVQEESLYQVGKNDNKESRKVFETKPPASEDSGDIKVSYVSGKGMPPDVVCIRSSAILPQMKSKMPATSKRAKDNLKSIEVMINHLRNILFLDPMPSEMRDYVRKTDIELRSNGSNVSSALMHLCNLDENKKYFLSVIKDLPENEIGDISFIETQIGDVIFALTEKYGSNFHVVDAKRLSDGTLRCIAILTAVITGAENGMIIIEEIDNGIHPSRVKGLIDNISKIAKQRHIDIIITTHSATLLNGLTREQLTGVSVVYRNGNSGASEFLPFIDIGDYPKILADGGLGDSIVDESLIGAIKNPKKLNDFSWMGVFQ